MRSFVFVAVAALLGACSSPVLSPSELPVPSPSATATPAPTPTPAASTPGAALPYRIDLPSGWVAFDLSDPAAQASLDAFSEANPAMAGMVAAFQGMSNVSLYAQPLLGNMLIIIPVPSDGASLAVLGQNLTAQFGVVPGIVEAPVAEPLTLPIGDAMHWTIEISAAKPGGGTYSVVESIYLVVNEETALIVEFVAPSGAVIPDEDEIVQSLRFQP